MKKAVYAGSFDPPTIGHMETLQRAAELFDKVICAVAVNPGKKPTFTTEERLDILRTLTKDMSNVVVDSIQNEYLVRYAKRKGAEYIVRGIRNANDLVYESQLQYMNEGIESRVHTVHLIPPGHLAHISSSLVKSLIGPRGWEDEVSKYVDRSVTERLIAKFKK